MEKLLCDISIMLLIFNDILNRIDRYKYINSHFIKKVLIKNCLYIHFNQI